MISIVIIVDHFGPWPEWMPLFLLSCQYNPTIQWVINSDSSAGDLPENVRLFIISESEYRKLLKHRLGIRTDRVNPYKICDYRPAFGELHAEQIQGFDYFGYGDIDVVYGQIRDFYDDSVLSCDVISTHDWCISGHLALFRNCPRMVSAFRRVPDWLSVLSTSDSARFDEDAFSKLFVKRPLRRRLLRWVSMGKTVTEYYASGCYMKEQYTTPLVPGGWICSHEHPKTWYWKEGVITNSSDGDRTFIYLHFMNYKHPRHLHPQYQGRAPWTDLDKILSQEAPNYRNGFRIELDGIHPL